ncbi:MAG: PAS domain-containing protein [Piscirickettsiaceae bacterium]|nr:PAS domain-containing protein [Piscirickettsiaceae bacterium]
MSSRISLFSTNDEPLLEYLNLNLSAGVFLEHIDTIDDLYSRMENNYGIPDILILGLAVQEPIRIAEHTHRISKSTKIIIFCLSNQEDVLRESIRFSPFLSSDVSAYIFKEKEEFLTILQNQVNVIENQRNYQATMVEVEKERLASITNQPLVANYLDKLLDRIPIGILNIDSKGKILNLNPSAQRLLNHDERSLIGTYLFNLFPQKELIEIKGLINDVVNDDNRNDNSSEIFCFKDPSGNLYFEMTISILSYTPIEPILNVILQEVTLKVQEESKRLIVEKALHQSEQQLKLVINAIPELIAYVDQDLRFQFNNKAYEKWFGRTREEIIGKKVWEVIGEKSYKIIEHYVKRVLSGETVTFEEKLAFEEKLNYPQKREVFIRSTYIPNFSETGDVIGYVLLTSDITQSKRDEELEKKHMLELAHTSRIITIGEMSSQLAHELSQPLTSIEAYSRACITLIQKDQTTEGEILNALENVSSQAIRAQEIMHELRNFVKKEDSRKCICINDLIKSAIKLLQLEFQENDPAIELNLRGDLPEVFADRILIEQILINLIKNAIEAMRTLAVSERRLLIESSKSQNGEVSVSVHDSGPGLSEYEINKIFEPFYTTKPEGMGMGLAITRSIIHSHGGDLIVNQNSHGGTTFKFTLPVEDIEFLGE